MPLIWDTKTQAFVESEIPKTYDPTIQAYRDTEGYVPNFALEAWQKDWPKLLYLYKDGDLYTNVTGGWGMSQCTASGVHANARGQLNNTGGRFYGQLSTNRSILYRGTTNMIDLSDYKTLNMLASWYTDSTTLCAFIARSNSDAYLWDGAGYPRDIVKYGEYRGSAAGNVVSLDVSDITGSNYIECAIACTSASGGVGTWLEVKQIWLE